MCIDAKGIDHLKEGQTYTYDGDMQCNCNPRRSIYIAEITSIIFFGNACHCDLCKKELGSNVRFSFFKRRFVPLNDPDTKFEVYHDEITGPAKGVMA